ncbi:MAG: ankyrin repeat domain-containing protein [Balneolales bacterium]|nr:ankyrin repeat domain-containing protein [Balneolales bacterium]
MTDSTTLEITADEQRRYEELQKIALGMARAGDTDELRKMLEAGMPVNLADEKGNTLLMLATYNENPETTQLLLEFGADVDRRNDRGQTPLGGMAFKGNARIARMLIDAGADLQANNGAGMTPLHYARMFGRTEVAELLETSGAHYRVNHRKAKKEETRARKSFLLLTVEFIIKIRGLFGRRMIGESGGR